MTVLRVMSDNQCQFGDEVLPCAIGRGGFSADKREGDGATPVGVWPMRRVLYRPDRVSEPKTQMPTAPILASDGWCDDPTHAAYNTAVTLPFAANHEVMWRDDGLYDIVVVLGHNDDPPVPGRGSAIFLHCAKPNFSPTEGCVALAPGDVLRVLAACGPVSAVSVEPPS